MSYGREQRGTVIAIASASSGIGFGGLLAILFIGLRLAGIIDWPWVWVLAPAWIPGSIVLLALIVLALAFIGAGIADTRARDRQRAPRPDQHGPAHRWGRRW